MPGHTNDTTLLAGLLAGRDKAFADVYDRFADRLLATAWGLLGNRADAEDTVQDVFVALARSRASRGEVRNLTAYLFAALRHEAARRRRRPAPGPLDDRVLEAPAAAPAEGLVAAERTRQLENAMQSLPAEQREVIALKIDGGLTFADIAAVLDISPNTAASRYRYALARLRDRLEGRDV